jgi:phosphoenolpyruvate-protein phosphotransferase (PTS system enzyme I)
MSRDLTGIGVSPGIASGPVERLAPAPTVPVDLEPAGDPDSEQRATAAAIEATAADLDARSQRARGAPADVLAAQVMMAQDPVLGDRMAALIKEGVAAPNAVIAAFDEFRAQLSAAGPYMAERAADLDDIRNRVVAHLLGLPMPGVPDPGHPFVLIARDLAPADTVTLDPAKVLAIVTELGGPTSHTAIISKSLGIPAVVGCGAVRDLVSGAVVMVDGAEGVVTVDPEATVVAARLARLAARRAALTEVCGPGRTSDGTPVQLLINLGGERDLALVAAADSEGVGLFRTEFMFLERPDAPTVEEQRAAYARVFHAFTGRKVIVRTLDAGADKPLRFVTQPDEPNPALGLRGLRTSRRFPDLMDDQLRAIARAAAGSGADVWVMAPMVSTAGEARGFADRAHAHGLPVAGAMVEVPAAALQATTVAAACDFMSIGTNDLAQYTFAADRMAGELADLLDPWQPALLELIRLTADAGRRAGRPVGVCGEAASDPALALVLVGLGVTSLSMAPTSLPEVRQALVSHSLTECQAMAALALRSPDGRVGRDGVRKASNLI